MEEIPLLVNIALVEQNIFLVGSLAKFVRILLAAQKTHFKPFDIFHPKVPKVKEVLRQLSSLTAEPNTDYVLQRPVVDKVDRTRKNHFSLNDIAELFR